MFVLSLVQPRQTHHFPPSSRLENILPPVRALAASGRMVMRKSDAGRIGVSTMDCDSDGEIKIKFNDDDNDGGG